MNEQLSPRNPPQNRKKRSFIPKWYFGSIFFLAIMSIGWIGLGIAWNKPMEHLASFVSPWFVVRLITLSLAVGIYFRFLMFFALKIQKEPENGLRYFVYSAGFVLFAMSCFVFYDLNFLDTIWQIPIIRTGIILSASMMLLGFTFAFRRIRHRQLEAKKSE